MNTQNETASNETAPAPEATGRASYCPEDNKLRLYVGRVPRDEYEQLRAEGWTSTPKQSCDFVAVWNPDRYETAARYAGGIIEDEDQSPAERAADRAERFSGYREKRTAEAVGLADRYDAGPSAHGYQSQARAERAAARHDRLGGYACDSWSKAEYWQHRTAGVISHALHLCKPGVRMGRIKEIETELRRLNKSREEFQAKWERWQKIAAMTDAAKQTEAAEHFAGFGYGGYGYKHPRTGEDGSLWDFLREDATDRLTGSEAAALYFAAHTDPASPEWNETRTAVWVNHLNLRLAYENQMLAAQGGRLEQCEVLPGGKLGGRLIVKVSKSTATGRATSCDVLGPKVYGYTYKAANIPGTEFAAYRMDLERLSPDAYTPPTPESLAELASYKAARKASEPAKPVCPLINPTDADAERLQAIFNAARSLTWEKEPAEVQRITQKVYSSNTGGSYSACETKELTGGGVVKSTHYMSDKGQEFPTVCKVRVHGRRVVVITDKPQKPFPAELWTDPRKAAAAECVAAQDEIRAAMGCAWSSDWTPAQKELVQKAVAVGFVSWASMTQFHMTEEGLEKFEAAAMAHA